jgi:hypothetical protein
VSPHTFTMIMRDFDTRPAKSYGCGAVMAHKDNACRHVVEENVQLAFQTYSTVGSTFCYQHCQLGATEPRYPGRTAPRFIPRARLHGQKRTAGRYGT